MKKFLVFLSIILFFGCQEQVIELDIPDHDPFLVVNGILNTDSIISLNVSHSVGAFDQDSINSLSDADILLIENGEEIGQMVPEGVDNFWLEGSYNWTEVPIFNYVIYGPDGVKLKPQSGSNYTIEVGHVNYEPVFAETTVPLLNDIINSEVVSNTHPDLNSTLNFSLPDVLGKKNHYRLILYKFILYEGGQKKIPIELHSNDPSFTQGGIPWQGYSFSGQEVVFTDDLFEDEIKDISFDFNLEDDATLLLEITSFSEEAFDYFNSIYTNSNKFIFNFGTEPVPIFTNVENGAGIFASETSKTYISDLDENDATIIFVPY